MDVTWWSFNVARKKYLYSKYLYSILMPDDTVFFDNGEHSNTTQQ